MDILMRAWSYFATNILQQPAWMIGLIVLIGLHSAEETLV